MGIAGKICLRKTTLYKDCNELSIWNYIQIMATKDLKYLIKSGPSISNEKLASKMEQINKEFSELRGEETMVNKFDLLSYKEELNLQVHYGSIIVDRLYNRLTLNLIAKQTFDGLIAELENWGFYLDKETPLIEELENVRNEINALQTTIDSLQAEIYPEVEEKEMDENDNVSLNFHSILLTYQRILKIDRINPKKTSLLEFVAIEKQVKETIKKTKTEK